MRTRFFAYITKSALTRGIFRVEVEDCFDTAEGMVHNYQKNLGGSYNYYHDEGVEWHRTWPGAKAKAEAMRDAKIKGLKKQIAKLENITFEKPLP